jgi:hypothetical protein
LLRAYLAMALLITGDATAAGELVGELVGAADPDPAAPGQPSPGVQLDLYVLACAYALAGGDRSAAAAWVDAMSRYAETTGYIRYRAVAAKLAAAVADGTPLGDVPGLVWGASGETVRGAAG